MPKPSPETHVVLPADSNQALDIGQYALDFMWSKPSDRGGDPDKAVLERTELFHADACLCGVSALALGTNAPNLLRAEALTYHAPVAGFGSFGVPGSAKRLGATVFGVSVDAPFANAAFASKNGLNFDILSDYARAAVRAYDVAHDDFAGMTGYTAAKRSVFVIDGEGTIRYRWVAPNPGVEPNYDEVKAAVASIGGGTAA